MTADNVVVLRQIPIHDHLRKTAYILKARQQKHDPVVRGVHTTSTYGADLPLTIEAGFEHYVNVLSGKPEPITVVTQLFAENDAELQFNRALAKSLRRIFGCTVKELEFSRRDILRTLQDAVSESSVVPPSDVKLISLDEWWIRDYALDRSISGTSGTGSNDPLMPVDMFYGMPSSRTVPGRQYQAISEHWVFELEKATVPALTSATDPRRTTGADEALPAPPAAGARGHFTHAGRPKLPGLRPHRHQR